MEEQVICYKQVIYRVKVPPQSIIINCKRKRSNFTVEKAGRQHLIPMIDVNITSNGTNRSHVLPGRIQWEEHCISTIIFLPKMHNLYLIMRKPQVN